MADEEPIYEISKKQSYLFIFFIFEETHERINKLGSNMSPQFFFQSWGA